jgi:type VI secretion system protein ImpC
MTPVTRTQYALLATGPAPSGNRASLLDQIIDDTQAARVEAARPLVQRGVRELLRQLLVAPAEQAPPEALRVDRGAVDRAIAEIDAKLGRQLDKVLHDPRFQRLESAWRGLRFLVERTDFRQNIRISLLSVAKADLLADFRDAPELFQSGLYYHVHKAEYGQFGGRPYGAIIANYEFDASAPDLELLRHVSGVAATAHAPFIGAARPQFFGLPDYEGLPRLKDLRALFESKQYVAWRSLRDCEDSRYLGLTCPRFLLRRPYGPDNPVRTFHYSEETARHEDFLWGNTAFAFATRLTDSFARYRWCPNIVGPQGGGTVEQLPVHRYKSDGDLVQKIPTEVLIPEVLEYDLSEEGFIALTMRKDSDSACFFSASSLHKPRVFGQSREGKAAETTSRLGAQLPYLFIVSRLAHYIKVLQREALGTDKEKKDLQSELETWIRQYVTEDDSPMPGIRAVRPLRAAEIKVDEVAGRPGWYSVGIKIRPHFKYMGASFTLTLVGQQGPPGK